MGYRTFSCAVSGRCGGCDWLSVPYPIQLERKARRVSELLARLDDSAWVTGHPNIEPVLGMDEPLHFREKVISPLVRGAGGEVLCGLYARGSHRVIPCDGCLVTDVRAQRIVTDVAKLAKSFRMRPYDEDRRTGFLRHVLVRCAHATGQYLVTLVTTEGEIPKQRSFTNALIGRHPEIVTIVQNINTRATNAVLGTREHVLYGPGYIEDELSGCRFRISSRSFYQTNARQTEVLYGVAMRTAGLYWETNVLDAYCGIGTIAIIAARSMAAGASTDGGGVVLPSGAAPSEAGGGDASCLGARPAARATRGTVVGVELNGDAIHDARVNARLNGMGDLVRFVLGDAGEYMEALAEDAAAPSRAGRPVPDVVFMDPPRSGASRRFLESLSRLAPARVSYISCNPETQVRDLGFLCDRGYRIDTVQPVDMFPHTPHVETVALLTR